MASLPQLNRTSLREQVYDVLRAFLDGGDLQPGETINLDAIAAQLEVSRTPLRDAILRLETEGFVTIRPRSGVVVRTLTETDIRNLYQMIGALEASVLLTEGHGLTAAHVETMERANAQMQAALVADDFDDYYAANLTLHGAYTDMSNNAELSRHLKIMKQRLYDFPRKRDFIKEWELASTGEHDLIVAALKAGELREAARLVQEVHWSFEVQEKFIRRYYLPELESE
jgi:DNA-binding GntR family transcriptional regulator